MTFEMMGGTLDYVTEEGKGTTFRVELPAAPCALAPPPAPAAQLAC